MRDRSDQGRTGARVARGGHDECAALPNTLRRLLENGRKTALSGEYRDAQREGDHMAALPHRPVDTREDIRIRPGPTIVENLADEQVGVRRHPVAR